MHTTSRRPHFERVRCGEVLLASCEGLRVHKMMTAQTTYLPAAYCSAKGPRLRQRCCGSPLVGAEIQDLAFSGAFIIVAVPSDGQELMITYTAG